MSMMNKMQQESCTIDFYKMRYKLSIETMHYTTHTS